MAHVIGVWGIGLAICHLKMWVGNAKFSGEMCFNCGMGNPSYSPGGNSDAFCKFQHFPLIFHSLCTSVTMSQSNILISGFPSHIFG